MGARLSRLLFVSGPLVYSEVVEQNLDIYNPSVPNRRHYRIDCPFCEERVGKADAKGHMHLFTDTWFAHCFKCGGNFHATTVFEKLGILNYPKRSVTDVTDIVRGKVEVTTEVLPLREPQPVDLPDGTYPIILNPTLVMRRPHSRLLEWGIHVKTAVDMGWHWCQRKDSFVFPCFYHGEIVYWQTRGMGGSRSGLAGDYSTCGILYNFDDYLHNSVKEVYVVEGPKDAAVMHQNGLWAVALLGHAISPYQMLRLDALPHEKRLVLDADVYHSSRELEAKGIKTFYLPSGDPADSENRNQLSTVLEQSTGLPAQVRQLIKNRQAKS